MSKLPSTIAQQLSGTIRQNYPRFVEFLRAYYEWLENPDNPYYQIRNHLSFLDFEKSLDSYVDQMKKEYLVNIPESILGNPEQFIKYSKQFNLSIGSEKSFNFVFNMLYGEDVDIYYPKNDILRGSDGKWISDEFKFYVTAGSSAESFLNKRVVQEKEIAQGVFEYAYATAIRSKSRFIGGYRFNEIVVTDIDGTFEFDYPIYPQGNESNKEWFMPVGTQYVVNDGGVNYRQGDLLKLTTNDKYVIQRLANRTGLFDTRVTTDYKASDLKFFVDNVQITNFLYDGRTITSNQISSGKLIEVRFPIYQGFIIVDQIGGSTGDIQTINVIEPPIGVNGYSYQLDASEGGSGADIDISQGTSLTIPGYYRNDDGHLSSTKVLQDGEFYQEYSYVIRSSQNIESYRDVVLEVLHPAGMKMFGQINIKFLIQLMIRNIDFDITIKPPIQLIESIPSLGPTTSFLDRQKNNFTEDFVLVEDYSEIVVGDIVETPLKRWNIADFKYRSVCEDVYVDTEYYAQGYVCQGAEDVVNCIDDYTDPNYYKFGYICDANV